MGLPDPAMNARLRAAVIAARAAACRRTISSARSRRPSGGDGENYEEIRYEGFGPGGVALIVEALTDNRNRTATNVRTIVSKNGGNLGASGSVSHGFDRMGLIDYPASAGDADKVFEAALEAGAEDVVVERGRPRDLDRAGFAARGRPRARAGAGRGRGHQARLAAADQRHARRRGGGGQLIKLIDALDDDDDVQAVWGNYEVPDEVMDRLG